MDQFCEAFWGLWPLIIGFGPGVFLFLRYHFKGVQPSKAAYFITIALAYFLLFQNMAGRSKLTKDHKVACEMLREEINDPEAEWQGLPRECYRHTPDYLAEEAAYWASQG